MSANVPERTGTVLLVDVADAPSLPDFPAGRDRRLRALSHRHVGQGWIAADYALTAGDRFQAVLWNAANLPDVLLDIRRVFAPWEVYIAVGCGPVAGWRSRRPEDEALSGAGVERARQAMDRLKSARGEKFRRLTRCDTGDPGLDGVLNLVYALHDSLVQQTTERQWQTISSALSLESQEDAAAELGVQPSTVTRNLKRGHYWQMRETARELSRLLAAR